MNSSATRWAGHARVLRRDPVLMLLAAWTALAVALFFAFAGNDVWQTRVFWGFQPATDFALAFFSWRVARLATGEIRRFWLVLTGVGTLFLIGDSYQAVLSFVDPEHTSTTGGTVQSVCFAIGLAATVLAMLVHPHPTRSGRERLAFWLDSATLLVGGAVIAWVFAGGETSLDVVNVLATAAVAITGTFAAVKMILSGNAPMNRIAALPMMFSAAVMSVGILIAPAEATALGPLVYAVRFLPSLLIASGPRIQEVLAHHDPATFGERRRKPYSLLPYGSMAIAFGTLIVILPAGVDARLWGVVVGLGVICALVAARQLVAFHDNAALTATLRRQAQTDGLTGLANRTHFHERLDAGLAAGPVALLIIDLDGFKAVNDTRGHAAGDVLLAGVARRLLDTVRAEDLPARLGGDEFAVLLPGACAAEAEKTAARVLAAFQAPEPIAASIGVAVAGPGDDSESLMRHADLAMYAAKSAGKGSWRRHGSPQASMDIA